MHQTPNLFCQRIIIEFSQLLETYSTFSFGPTQPPNFSNGFSSASSPRCPHQSFQINISISLQIPKGGLKHPIAKVEIAWTTAFKRTSFPTCDKSFSFHPWSFP